MSHVLKEVLELYQEYGRNWRSKAEDFKKCIQKTDHCVPSFLSCEELPLWSQIGLESPPDFEHTERPEASAQIGGVYFRGTSGQDSTENSDQVGLPLIIHAERYELDHTIKEDSDEEPSLIISLPNVSRSNTRKLMHLELAFHSGYIAGGGSHRGKIIVIYACTAQGDLQENTEIEEIRSFGLSFWLLGYMIATGASSGHIARLICTGAWRQQSPFKIHPIGELHNKLRGVAQYEHEVDYFLAPKDSVREQLNDEEQNYEWLRPVENIDECLKLLKLADPSEFWGGVWEKVRALTERHGDGARRFVQLAQLAQLIISIKYSSVASTLIDGMQIIFEHVSTQRSQRISDDSAQESSDKRSAQFTRILIELSDDIGRIEEILALMSDQLSDQIERFMSFIAASDGFKDLSELKGYLYENHREDVEELKERLKHLSDHSELKTIQLKLDELLSEISVEGDMRAQIREILEVMLDYGPSLEDEGLTKDQISEFIQLRDGFSEAMLTHNLPSARKLLDRMRELTPRGFTYLISKMTLHTTQLEFASGEEAARKLRERRPHHPLIEKAWRSSTRLTKSASSLERSPSPTLLEIGSKIGDQTWELLGLLGQGGMGTVYHARNRFGREGALKMINSADSTDRFQHEIQALERINHANVIRVIAWGQDTNTGRWYYVMPLVEGESLERCIKERGSLTSRETLHIALGITSGLIACHDQGIIHRDISPDNIMLDPNGEVILIDFGIAHQEGLSSGHSQIAKEVYAAPEQLEGSTIDETVDLHALGYTLRKCLGEEASRVFWNDLIAKLTHHSPQNRGTAQELFNLLWMIQELLTLTSGEEISAIYSALPDSLRCDPQFVIWVMTEVSVHPVQIFSICPKEIQENGEVLKSFISIGTQ